MKSLLTRHWLAKLLSLLLATGIWLLVNNRITTDKNNTSKPVPSAHKE